jgi:tryptophan-rich hypothetical protein
MLQSVSIAMSINTDLAADGSPAAARPTRNRLSPRKLLLSKWTAATPSNREKHFVVIRVIEPEPPEAPVELVEIEAVHSKRTFLLHWRELTDRGRWRQGWV